MILSIDPTSEFTAMQTQLKTDCVFVQVMLVIDAAVSHLDDLHTLEDFLLNLGRKHQTVGVKTQSFTVSTLCLHGLVMMTAITSVTLKRQRWQWDWQWSSGRVTVIFQTIDWLTGFFHMFLRWLESPCSICFSPAWVRLTRHRCARLGSICTASWHQPWPEAGPRMANISPTEKEVDVRFTLEHPGGHKLTS